MGNGASAIIGNVAYLGFRFVQLLFSTASAFVTEGLTAPFAIASLLTLTSSIRDFINDPYGDPNRTVKDVASKAAGIFGTNPTNAVINMINNNSDMPIGGGTIPNIENSNKFTQSVITQAKRVMPNQNQIDPHSIARLSDPVIRGLDSLNSNRHINEISNTIKNSINSQMITNNIQTISS